MYYIVNTLWELKLDCETITTVRTIYINNMINQKRLFAPTLYTTIPHSKLKDKLREMVQLCFIKTNGQRRYKYFVLGRDSTKKFSETDIINMIVCTLTYL
jgi:hypothetical protein